MGYPNFVGEDIEKWMEQFHFSTAIKIRFSETDAYGHVNNVSYFTYFEQSRLEYMEHLGIVEQLVNESSDTLVVTANLECHYLNQLHYGQIIHVHVKTVRIGKSSFDLEYVITDQEKEKIAAVGRGTIVHVNRMNNRSEAIPEAIKEKLTRFDMVKS